MADQNSQNTTLSPIAPAGPKLVRLNLGSGPKDIEGYVSVDIKAFPNVQVVADLGHDPWPWNDNSVDEIRCSHMIEHLKPMERVFFVNEMYRVMKPGTKAVFWVPHWSSARAYGDLTHEWPPVTESWLFHLQEKWRVENAAHEDFYKCNFEGSWGYSPSPTLAARNQEYQTFAMQNYKDSIMDFVFTLTKTVLEAKPAAAPA